MTRSHRQQRQAPDHQTPGRTSQLVTLNARVRSVGLTPQGHLACVLDTSAGRLKALSDAAGVHLPELAVGREVQVALLRLKRVTEDAVWHWQLLGCRGVEPTATGATQTEREGSLA